MLDGETSQTFSLIWSNTNLSSILPKLIFRYNAISVKIPAGFLMDFNKLIVSFYMKMQRVKNSPEKERALPDIKAYSKAIAIKTVGVLVQG